MKISASIPGGNFYLEGIDGHVVRGRQELRDTTEWWFHWRLRMDGLNAGETWRIEFTDGEVVGPFGPAVRFDGQSWRYLGTHSRVSGACFTFTTPRDCAWAEFAFSIPYDPTDWAAFVSGIRSLPFVREEILCETAKGRPAPVLHIGNSNAHGRLLLTARHHACETTGNYLIEGIVHHLLERNDPLIYPVLQRYEIIIVPFMDLDGVIDGDQGKARAPHDHNRDYIDEPLYDTVAQVQSILNSTKDLIVLDCHSPYKWGKLNDHAFLVRPNDRRAAFQVAALGRELRILCSREDPASCLIYEQLFDKRAQTDWGGNYVSDAQAEALRNEQATTCNGYAARHGALLAASFETPYFGTENNPANPYTIRNLGRKLGLSLEHYLMSNEE